MARQKLKLWLSAVERVASERITAFEIAASQFGEQPGNDESQELGNDSETQWPESQSQLI